MPIIIKCSLAPDNFAIELQYVNTATIAKEESAYHPRRFT
jgi:hypothetical protein